MRLLFIHRSVGQHLIRRGDLRSRLAARGIELDDYNNNNDSLTSSNGSITHGAIKIPGNNTNPSDLAAYFKDWPDLLDRYDAIMIKSCYPNSHISSDAQLETVKGQYRAIFQACKRHKKPLIVLTTPPLRPLSTNPDEAKRANALAAWLMAGAGEGVQVFDLHTRLSESAGRHAGTLRRRYRYWMMPWDNHPNATADRDIAPELVDFIASLGL